jgi:hypothetical protein
MTPVIELSVPMLRYLTEIDHHGHEAMIAVCARAREAGSRASLRSCSQRTRR